MCAAVRRVSSSSSSTGPLASLDASVSFTPLAYLLCWALGMEEYPRCGIRSSSYDKQWQLIRAPWTIRQHFKCTVQYILAMAELCWPLAGTIA